MHRSPTVSLIHPRRSAIILMVAGLLWLGAVGAGFSILAREEFTPVPTAASIATFPAHSALALAPDRPTLIVFAHPRCPCTRATMRELDELRADLGERAAVTIAFTLPPGVAPGWEQGELWQRANAMPGVRVMTDRDGAEARRFGVKGSGHALLYRPSGQLLFSGGITPSRGHEGNNVGRSSITHLVRGETSLAPATPVFGCPLLERE